MFARFFSLLIAATASVIMATPPDVDAAYVHNLLGDISNILDESEGRAVELGKRAPDNKGVQVALDGLKAAQNAVAELAADDHAGGKRAATKGKRSQGGERISSIVVAPKEAQDPPVIINFSGDHDLVK